jgi:hypothetical protein
VNRLKDFPSALPAEQRYAWLDELISEIEATWAPRLNSQEHAQAVAIAQLESDPRVAGRIWFLLAHDPRDDAAVALARRVVLDPQGRARWSAFQYLRAVDRTSAGALAASAIPQPDSELLFFIADMVLESDPHRGLALMIGLPELETNHWVFDQVSDTLARMGGDQELSELRRRGQAVGGRNVYLVLADTLATEIRQRPLPPQRLPK